MTGLYHVAPCIIGSPTNVTALSFMVELLQLVLFINSDSANQDIYVNRRAKTRERQLWDSLE